jgi:hypothetical protein
MADESVPKPATPAVPQSALEQGLGGGVDPNLDPARLVLDQAQIDQQSKHNAWDMFHQAVDETDLVNRMEKSSLSKQVKHDLWDAKHNQVLINSARTADAVAEAKKNTQRSKITGNLPSEEMNQNLPPDINPNAILALGPGVARQMHLEPPSAAENLEATNKALKETAIVGGAIVAPELLPELAPEAGFIARGARLLKGVGLAGAGAGIGTAVGRTITGEDPTSLEGVQEAGGNVAKYGFGQLVGGVTGEAVGSVANALKKISTPAVDVTKAGEDLIQSITGGAAASEKTVVNNVMTKLQEAHDAMSDEYGKGLEEIGKMAKDVPIKVNGSPLQETVSDLMNGPKGVPSAVGEAMAGLTPGSEQLRPLLESLSGEKGQPQNFTWDEMVQARKFINGKWRRLTYDNPVKWDLQRILYGIDDTMQQAAEEAGIPNLAENFKDLRKVYATKSSLFAENAIKTLKDKSPDSVADILIGRSGQKIKNIESLRTLIGEDAMPEVEGNILDKLLHKASDNGVTDINKFRKSFEALGHDLQQAIWGDNLPEIKRFIDTSMKNTDAGEWTRKLLRYLPHSPLGGYMTVKTFLDVARGASPKKIATDLGLFAASVMAGEYGKDLMMAHGARVADILSKAGRFVANPNVTALGTAAVDKALSGETNEEAGEEVAPEQTVFKPGDTVYQNGRPFTVKTVDENGKVTGAE